MSPEAIGWKDLPTPASYTANYYKPPTSRAPSIKGQDENPDMQGENLFAHKADPPPILLHVPISTPSRMNCMGLEPSKKTTRL